MLTVQHSPSEHICDAIDGSCRQCARDLDRQRAVIAPSSEYEQAKITAYMLNGDTSAEHVWESLWLRWARRLK